MYSNQRPVQNLLSWGVKNNEELSPHSPVDLYHDDEVERRVNQFRAQQRQSTQSRPSYRRRTTSSTNSKIGKGSRLASNFDRRSLARPTGSGIDISGITYEEDERFSRLSLGEFDQTRDSLAKPKLRSSASRARSTLETYQQDDHQTMQKLVNNVNQIPGDRFGRQSPQKVEPSLMNSWNQVPDTLREDQKRQQQFQNQHRLRSDERLRSKETQSWNSTKKHVPEIDISAATEQTQTRTEIRNTILVEDFPKDLSDQEIFKQIELQKNKSSSQLYNNQEKMMEPQRYQNQNQGYDPNYEFQQQYAQMNHNFNQMSPSDYNDDPAETYDDMNEGNAVRRKYTLPQKCENESQLLYDQRPRQYKATAQNEMQPPRQYQQRLSPDRIREDQARQYRSKPQAQYQNGIVEAAMPQSQMHQPVQQRNKSREQNLKNQFNEDWMEIHQQMNLDYKKNLKQINEQAANRMMKYQEEYKDKLEGLTREHQEKMRAEEMKECTFQPNVHRNGRSGSGVRRRSTSRDFVLKQEALARRKQRWIDEQNDALLAEQTQLREQHQMNPNSRRIVNNSSVERQSFLERNYYQQKPKYHANASQLNSVVMANRSQAAGNSNVNISRQSQQSTNKDYEREQFHPHINPVSKAMSPRNRPQQTFDSLYNQAAISNRQHQEAQIFAQKQVIKNSNQSILQNGNSKTDAILIRQLNDEFQRIKQTKSELYLLEVLEQLHFIQFQQDYTKQVLEHSKNNILVYQSHQDYNNVDIQRNLFRISCAIMNLKTHQEQPSTIDEGLLNQYLSQIQNGVDADTLLMQQFAVIKNLINRKEFNLSDRHTSMIHQNFKDLSAARKNSIFGQRRDQRQQRHYNDKPSNTFANRRQTSREISNQGLLRSQQLHSTAALQKQRLAAENHELMDENTNYSFRPQINNRSKKLSRTNSASMHERSQEHLLRHQLRRDRDPREIEYERQREHLKFKPQINKVNTNSGKIHHQGGQQRERSFIRENDPYKGAYLSKHSSGASQPRTEPRGSSMNRRHQFDTPTSKKSDLEFRGSFIKKSEEKRLSRASGKGLAEDARNTEQISPQHQHGQHHHHHEVTQPQKPLVVASPVEPICVLKIELDDEIVEHIKIYPNEDPEQVVNEFGDKFDLSANAKQRLLEQINMQIQQIHQY